MKVGGAAPMQVESAANKSPNSELPLNPPKSREAGELSSEDNDEYLICSVAHSTGTSVLPTGPMLVPPVNKFTHGNQAGKAVYPASSADIQCQISKQPTSQKSNDANSVPLKPAIPGWRPCCAHSGPNNNLVISLSDDDSQSDSEEKQCGKLKALQTKSNTTRLITNGKPPISSLAKPNKLGQPARNANKVMPKKLSMNSTCITSMVNICGVNSRDSGPSSVEQGCRAGNFNFMNKNIVHREHGYELEDLQQQIAFNESELKLKEGELKLKSAQRSKKSVTCKDDKARDLYRDRAAKCSTRYSDGMQIEPKEPDIKRIKVSDSFSTQLTALSPQELPVPKPILPSKNPAMEDNTQLDASKIDHLQKEIQVLPTELSIVKWQNPNDKHVSGMLGNIHTGVKDGPDINAKYIQSDERGKQMDSYVTPNQAKSLANMTCMDFTNNLVAGVVAELVNGNADMIGEIQGEALIDLTYVARSMDGEASAPAVTTSVSRVMVDLAKKWPTYTAIGKRVEFLKGCGQGAAHAVKMARVLSSKTEEKNSIDFEDTCSSQKAVSSLPHEQDQSGKTSIISRRFPPAQVNTSSEDIVVPLNSVADEKAAGKLRTSQLELNQDDARAVQNLQCDNADLVCHGTTNVVIRLRWGIIIAVDSRAVVTRIFFGTRIKVSNIVDDNAMKFKEITTGVYVTACGNANRNEELWKYLIQLVNTGVCTEIYSLREQAHTYLKEHPLPSTSRGWGIQLFMAGWNPRKQDYVVYRIADGDHHTLTLRKLYGTLGSGSHHANEILAGENITLDMNEEQAGQSARRALVRSAKCDPNSGGYLRVFFGTKSKCRSLCERHAITVIRDSPESIFPTNELYIILEKQNDNDLSSLLRGSLLKFDNEVNVQCLGAAGRNWFLYHAVFVSEVKSRKLYYSCQSDKRLSPQIRVKQFPMHPRRNGTGYVGFSSRTLLNRAQYMSSPLSL